jgi:hypothetical protein
MRKLAYGFAVFMGFGMGVALNSQHPITSLIFIAFLLLGWAIVCKADEMIKPNPIRYPEPPVSDPEVQVALAVTRKVLEV